MKKNEVKIKDGVVMLDETLLTLVIAFNKAATQFNIPVRNMIEDMSDIIDSLSDIAHHRYIACPKIKEIINRLESNSEDIEQIISFLELFDKLFDHNRFPLATALLYAKDGKLDEVIKK